MLTAGNTLRQMREKLGLTMRDVETASERLARKRSNVGYFVPISRLSYVETQRYNPEHFSSLRPRGHLPWGFSRDAALVRG